MIDTLKKLPDLKAVFLNYNPVLETENFSEILLEAFPGIELLNSKLTKNAGEFGLKFCHYNYSVEKATKLRTVMLKQLNLSKRGVGNL